MTAVLDGLSAAYRQYICRACGLVYDEAQGDPDSGLPPGTRFEDIPEDWSCPLCGVTKSDFTLCLPASPPGAPAGQAIAPPLPGRVGRGAGIVIVGGGCAGWAVAEAVRALDATVPLTLVCACGGDVYDKPMLSVAVARGLTPADLVRERGHQAAARLRVRLMPETHAVRVEAERRRLRTTRGPVPYDHLVLAHGARPVLPAGLPAELCRRVNHLGGYAGLRASLDGAARDVVIVGAGLIGCELANDLALGGHRVTLLESAAEPLAPWSGQAVGHRLLAAWQGLSIRFVGNVKVTAVTCEGAARVVSTACGQRFVADEVVVAVGLHTPDRLARSAGLAWHNGVVVDPVSLQTSDPCIHALGDCISLGGQPCRFVEPIGRQALTLAARLCGADAVPYEHRVPPVRLKTRALPLTLPVPVPLHA